MLLLLAAPATSSRDATSFNPSRASIDVGRAVVVQSDGKIVVAGTSRRGSRYGVALARYTTKGKLDASFASGGLLLATVGRRASGANAIAEQPDGKLVVAGWAYVSDRQGAFAVARYTRQGAIDRAFGRDGKALTAFRKPEPGKFSLASVSGVALQRDGRIVAAGVTSDVARVTRVALARYTRAGRLDVGFGKGGKVEIDSGPLRGVGVRAVALQPDGKVVVVGYGSTGTQNHFTVARFTNRGAVDRGFGNGGRVTTVLGYWSEADAVAVQADGKVVVAGSVRVAGAGTQLGLVRYLQDGRRDLDFGTDGSVLTDFAVQGAPAVVIQPDGRIVVACGLNGPRRFGLGRYDIDGALDPTFGEAGKVRTKFRGGSAARGVARQRDGRIVAAGSAGGDFAVARYTTDGTLDPTFGSRGTATTPVGPAWLRRGK